MKNIKGILTGALAGFANGFFGAGGGLFLVPLYVRWMGIDTKKAFATSIAVILPLSAVSLFVYYPKSGVGITSVLPLMLGGLGRRDCRGKTLPQNPRRAAAQDTWSADYIRRDKGAAAMKLLLDFVIGLAAGILSGFGIGGGSLLILYLVFVLEMPQFAAAGVNLLYFLFCAPPALVSHLKNRLIDLRTAAVCIAAGIPALPRRRLCRGADRRQRPASGFRHFSSVYRARGTVLKKITKDIFPNP